MSLFPSFVFGNATPLSVSVSPIEAFGARTGSGPCYTNGVTASATGGVAPYSYAWSYVSGDTFTITDAANAHTQFSANVNLQQDKTATYRCTVTDALGSTAHFDITVYVQELSYF